MPTFGEIISEKRKKTGLSQKELAALVTKEDGKPISPQYLNDIERDRRNPPSEHLIEQFARVLSIALETLYYCAGELPPSGSLATQSNKLASPRRTAARAFMPISRLKGFVNPRDKRPTSS